MSEEQQQPKQFQLSPQQIAQACATGLSLLNDDERVTITPSMAKSGDLVVLDHVLGAMAKGELVVTSPQVLKEHEALKKAEELRGAAANGEDNED
jgi:hypothetical protein